MRVTSLDAVLQEIPEPRTLVALRSTQEAPSRARFVPRMAVPWESLPEAVPGASADVALGVATGPSLRATVAALRAAVRDGGTVLLVAEASGSLGVLGQLFGAPLVEASELSEALLEVGVVELASATTKGTLRRELLVWGTALPA